MKGLMEDENGNRRASFLLSLRLSISGLPCLYVICACIEFFGEVGHFTERSGFLELCVIREKVMIYRVVSYDIRKRCSVQDKENGPHTEPWGTLYMRCDGDEDKLLTEVDQYQSERYD